MVVEVLLGIACALGVLTVAGACRRHRTPGALWLALFAAAITWWDLWSMLELSTDDYNLMLLASKVEYLAIAAMPIAWLQLAVRFRSGERSLPGWVWYVVTPVALLVPLVVFTNDVHHLVWASITRLPGDSTMKAVYRHGPLWFAIVAWTYILVSWGTLLLIRTGLSWPRQDRRKAWLLVGAVLVPWLANLAYAAGAIPLSGVEPTPIALSVTAAVLLVALRRFHLLDLTPIAADVLLANLFDAVLVIDEAGCIAHANPAAHSLGLLVPGAGVGQPAAEACAAWPSIAPRLSERDWLVQADVHAAAGPRRALEIRGLNLDTGEGAVGHLLVGADVTARKRTEAALRHSEQRFRGIVETTHEGIWQVDASGHTVYANRRLAELLGCTEADLLRSSVLDFIYAEDRAIVAAQLRGYEANGAGHFEARFRRADDEPVWLLAAINRVSGDDGEYLGLLGMFADITERKQVETELARQALHDGLTGLANRTLLYDRLELAINGSSRDGRPFALLVLDLDGFKQVNDRFGHLAGDRLLCQVAERLTRRLRAEDTVARLGGDEFAVILPGADASAAAGVARSLWAAFDEPIDLGSRRVVVGSSIGVAVYGEHGRDVETLMRCADTAMYACKRGGRGPVVFDSGLDTLAA